MSKLKELCRVHTDLLKMDNRQGATVQCRELCSMSRGRLDGRLWGRMDTCVYVVESFHFSPK